METRRKYTLHRAQLQLIDETESIVNQVVNRLDAGNYCEAWIVSWSLAKKIEELGKLAQIRRQLKKAELLMMIRYYKCWQMAFAGVRAIDQHDYIIGHELLDQAYKEAEHIQLERPSSQIDELLLKVEAFHKV